MTSSQAGSVARNATIGRCESDLGAAEPCWRHRDSCIGAGNVQRQYDSLKAHLSSRSLWRTFRIKARFHCTYDSCKSRPQPWSFLFEQHVNPDWPRLLEKLLDHVDQVSRLG